MRRSYFRFLAFGPLALALFLAAFATPFARDAGRLLQSLNSQHGEIVADMRAAFGVDLSALGPHIEFLNVPSPGADENPSKRGGFLRLYPAELKIEIDQTTQVVSREGFRVRWMLGDIRLTASFAEPPGWPDYFGSGGRPDWSKAVLRLPYPDPQSLADHPEITIDGRTWRMEKTHGPHNRLTLERGVTSLPMNEVVITYRRTAAGPDIVIGANGVRNQVYLSTDFPFERSSGPLPQAGQSEPLGSHWHWTVDRSATFDGVSDTAAKEASDRKKQFLGISIMEPSEQGDIALHSSLTEPLFSSIAGLVQFIPLTYALAAFMSFFCRTQGVWPQLALAFVTLPSLAASLYVAQWFGDVSGWYTGAAISATGAFVVLLPQGLRTATLVSLTFALAWVALLQVASGPHPPDGLPLTVLALRMGQQALLVIAIFAALIALVRYFNDRRGVAAGTGR